jgi:hypothetical protein
VSILTNYLNMRSLFSAAVAVPGLVLASQELNQKSYFEETFTVDMRRGPSMYDRWIHTHEPGYKKMFFQEGNLVHNQNSYGLYAGNANSKYAMSSALATPYVPQEDHLLNLEFDLTYEKGQTCGDGTIKLFGHKN